MTSSTHSVGRRARAVAVLRRRGVQAASVAVAVSTLCFAIVQRLPGDLALRVAAGRYGYDQVSVAAADRVRADLGLDRPAWQQWLDWLGDLLRLDLGTSLVTGGSVTHELGLHLAATVQLAAVALALACAVGTTLGALAEARPGGILDRTTTVWVSGTRAMPPFLLGLLLILVFSVHLGLVPAAGHGRASNVVLPAVTLAVGLSGLFARVTRDTVGQVLQSDYVGFAATKGLGRRATFLRHVVRNSGVTLVAYVGVQALILVEGVVVVESVFGGPGLGHALVHAIFWRDMPMIQASALALALLVVGLNLTVDLASLAIDPRPRRDEVRA